MSQPDVSIIVPVYKIREEWLRQSIESLLEQTHRNIEIILIDDGSPDKDGEICDKYALQDERITVLHQKNQGVSVARNEGVKHASGRYLMFIDPDDWIEAGCCEKMLHIIKEKKVKVAYFQQVREYEGRTEKIGKNETQSMELGREHIRKMQIAALRGDYTIYGFAYGGPWCKLIDKKFYTENRLGFVPGLRKTQDVIFNLYMFEILDKAYFFDFLGYHYRINQYSVDYRYNEDMPQIIKSVVREADKFISVYHKTDKEYLEALGCRCLRMFEMVCRTYLYHPEGNHTYSQIKNTLNDYFQDEIIARYFSICRLSVFSSVVQKAYYLIIKMKLYYVFHLFQKFRYRRKFQKLKLYHE